MFNSHLSIVSLEASAVASAPYGLYPNQTIYFLLQKQLREDCQDYISIIQEAIESKEDGEMAKGTLPCKVMLFCSISNL
jgi:hypothetical protein